jgi:hypothetical protein
MAGLTGECGVSRFACLQSSTLALDMLTPFYPETIVKLRWLKPWRGTPPSFAHESPELTDAVADIFCPSAHCYSPHA